MTEVHDRPDTTDIVSVFESVLQIEHLQPDDNFFDHGGNSLLGIELITKLQSDSGCTVSLIDLIRYPTPAGVHHLIHE